MCVSYHEIIYICVSVAYRINILLIIYIFFYDSLTAEFSSLLGVREICIFVSMKFTCLTRKRLLIYYCLTNWFNPFAISSSCKTTTHAACQCVISPILEAHTKHAYTGKWRFSRLTLMESSIRQWTISKPDAKAHTKC